MLGKLAEFGRGTGLNIPTPQGLPGQFSTVAGAIRTIFSLAVGVAAVIFLVLLLVGGIQYLTAAGNEEQSTKARRLIVDAIVGLIIVLIAWAAGQFILRSLGVSVQLF